MEGPSSVNKPQRISDAGDLPPTGVGVSGEHVPRLYEVYGFLGSITIVVATVIFIIWAYVPDRWLHSVGISFYPTRHWASVVPTYVIVTIVLAIGVYTGLNFLATPPPTSLKSMFDEFSKELLDDIPLIDDDEQPTVPSSDISVNEVNVMFNDMK